MSNRVEAETNNHLAKQDDRAKQLEEFKELTALHLQRIDRTIISMKNVAESFYDLDLDDEIKSCVMELL